MHNQLKYLLFSGLIAGCTVNNVEKGDTGGGANVGGSSTGGAAAQSGGTTNKAGATSVGGSSVAGGATSVGGSTSVGGTSLVGGSTGTAAATSVGGTSAVGGSTGTSVGGTTATGGATGTSVGGTAATGGTSSTSTGTVTGGTTGTSVGGTTATGGTSSISTGTATGGSSSTGGSGGGTGVTTIKLDALNGDCDIFAPATWVKAVYDTTDCSGIITVSSALTINAGAIVKFGTGSYILVDSAGTLTATGTASDPIIFTSLKDDAHGGDTNGDGATAPSKSDWGAPGTTGDIDVAGNSSQFDHIQMLYGKNGLWVRAASVKVTNSVFAHNSVYGLFLDGSEDVGATVVTGNAFFDNDGFPLSLGKFISLDATNVFHDPANAATKNKKQCIEVKANTVDTAVNLAVTEVAFFSPFFTIDSALTLANNVCFKTDTGGEIDLNAAGTIVNAANAIFTSAKDDAVGGDCTGDGATTPANGDWDGIWVTTGTPSTSDWATTAANIRYAGNSGTLPLH